MRELLAFTRLFGEFAAASWAVGRSVLARVTKDVRELWLLWGRGGGKTRLLALLVVFFATRTWKRVAGERLYAGLFAPDRRQSGVAFGYVRGMLHAVPALRAMIERETRTTIDLTNGVTVEVITAGRASPRGRSYVVAAVDEAAFLPNDEGAADRDVELLRALRPALARVPGSLLIVASTPYARRGVMFDAWTRYHAGSPGDVVFDQRGTLEANTTFSAAAVARAREEDPTSAAAEFDAQFRSDVETFVDRDAVMRCVVPGRVEIPPPGDVTAEAFFDGAGGSRGAGDSATLVIGYRTKDGRVVLLALREARPPFDPGSVVAEFAELLKSYRVRSVTGDRWAGEWPRAEFRKHAISYEVAAKPKSDLYKDALAALNSGTVELLDVPRLVAQIAALERRTARGGRDTIDHGPGGHDDLANSALGLVATIGAAPAKPKAGILGVVTFDGFVAGAAWPGEPKAPPQGRWRVRAPKFGLFGVEDEMVFVEDLKRDVERLREITASGLFLADADLVETYVKHGLYERPAGEDATTATTIEQETER